MFFVFMYQVSQVTAKIWKRSKKRKEIEQKMFFLMFCDKSESTNS